MVRRFVLLLAVSGAAFAQDEGIAATANSPYKLAKFVETHNDFDWEPLWKALNVKDAEIFLPRCEKNLGVAACSSELIALESPLEMLVRPA
jgi:hypothetical protein